METSDPRSPFDIFKNPNNVKKKKNKNGKVFKGLTGKQLDLDIFTGGNNGPV